jgi:hypothetical protein
MVDLTAQPHRVADESLIRFVVVQGCGHGTYRRRERSPDAQALRASNNGSCGDDRWTIGRHSGTEEILLRRRSANKLAVQSIPQTAGLKVYVPLAIATLLEAAHENAQRQLTTCHVGR